MNKAERVAYSAMIGQGLTEIASPEVQAFFTLGKEKLELFVPFIDSLDRILSYINEGDLTSIPEDMIATHALVTQRLETGIALPSPKNIDSHHNPHLARTFTRTLQTGNALLGEYFQFHAQTYDDNPEESNRLKLGASVVDGYSVFASLLYGMDSEHAIAFMETTANALCEVAAERSDKQDAIFQMAETTKWYAPAYGFDRGFLIRHNLLRE